MSSRIRKVAPKMAATLVSADNRIQAALACIEVLENDNAVIIEINDDDDASLNDDDQAFICSIYKEAIEKHKTYKTQQAKALENAKANLEALPPHVPSSLRAAVGLPRSTSCRHFCTACGFAANYTCVRCGMCLCAIQCQNIHNDTHLLNFVA